MRSRLSPLKKNRLCCEDCLQGASVFPTVVSIAQPAVGDGGGAMLLGAWELHSTCACQAVPR